MEVKNVSQKMEVQQPLHPTEEIKRFKKKIAQLKENTFDNLQEFIQAIDKLD